MKTYISTAIVTAEPCTYNDYAGHSAKYALVNDVKGYRVVDGNGDSKWVPKGTFERTYRPVSLVERAMVMDEYRRNKGVSDEI